MPEPCPEEPCRSSPSPCSPFVAAACGDDDASTTTAAGGGDRGGLRRVPGVPRPGHRLRRRHPGAGDCHAVRRPRRRRSHRAHPGGAAHLLRRHHPGTRPQPRPRDGELLRVPRPPGVLRPARCRTGSSPASSSRPATPPPPAPADPGYSLPDEFPAAGFSYVKGTVAMANSGTPNSGGSQFFIALDDIDLDPPPTPCSAMWWTASTSSRPSPPFPWGPTRPTPSTAGPWRPSTWSVVEVLGG